MNISEYLSKLLEKKSFLEEITQTIWWTQAINKKIILFSLPLIFAQLSKVSENIFEIDALYTEVQNHSWTSNIDVKDGKRLLHFLFSNDKSIIAEVSLQTRSSIFESENCISALCSIIFESLWDFSQKDSDFSRENLQKLLIGSQKDINTLQEFLLHIEERKEKENPDEKVFFWMNLLKNSMRKIKK